MSGSDDGLPGVAMVVALGVGLVGTFALAVRVLVWFLAWVFSVCCVLVQGLDYICIGVPPVPMLSGRAALCCRSFVTTRWGLWARTVPPA
jgi:hypothetical protein